MYRLLLLLVISLSASNLAYSDSEICFDNAVSQAQLNRCANLQRQEAETSMQSLLQQLQTSLPENPRQKLQQAQTAWQQMTQNDCEIEYWYMNGGSARSMILSLCYSRHIEDRNRTLQRLACHPMKEECPPESLEKP